MRDGSGRAGNGAMTPLFKSMHFDLTLFATKTLNLAPQNPLKPVVKVDQDAPEPSTGTPQIITLRSWAPNLLSSCHNLGLWPSEVCFKDSVGDQSLLVSLLTCITITDVFLRVFALPSVTATSFFILHSHSAVIKFRGPGSRNSPPPNLVTGAPNRTVPGPPILHTD